jgi:hypothetical protein
MQIWDNFFLKASFFVLFVLVFTKNINAQFYYGSQLEFGKNRIQYDREVWSHYKYQRYDIYFYLGGKNLALYTAQIAEQYLENLELTLDFQIEDQLQFIIYNKQSDFKQSNLGLTGAESSTNIGGTTRIVGSKLILYFEGDHDKFTKQLKAALAEVAFNQMMYGGNWKDVIRNSTLLTVPDWFSKGFASYYSTSWNPEIENFIKDGIKSNSYNELHRLSGRNAVNAGHSVWNYIAETYGKNVIPNILYMTRISRNIESGFLFVLGISLKNLMKEWKLFYANKFYSSDIGRNLPDYKLNILNKKQTRKNTFTQFKINTDATYAIYATNNMGQYKVYLHDLNSNKRKRIYKREHKLNRITDYSYPLINWHPKGDMFTFITEEQGQIWMHYYSLEDKKLEKRPILNFEKIISYQYAPDGKKFVMSAVQNGFSDIYVFNVASNSPEQITKDVYDDLYPCFFKGTNEIIFSSNRSNDTIKFVDDVKPVSPFLDLYSYNYLKRSPILRKLSSTEFINETSPHAYDSEHLSFLSDQNGIVNRFVGEFDSVLAYIDTSEHYNYTMKSFSVTNNARNILDEQISSGSNYISEIQLSEGKYRLLKYDKIPYSSLIKTSLKNTPYRDISKTLTISEFPEVKTDENKESKGLKTQDPEFKSQPSAQPKQDSARTFNKVSVFGKEEVEKSKTKAIDINNYVFENEVPANTNQSGIINVPKTPSIPSVPPADSSLIIADTEKPKSKEFKMPKTRNYNRFFTIDYLVSQLDNSFLNANYQLFNGGGPVYYNPGFNGLIKIGSSDLFEDYRISGGFRLSTDLRSNEFLLSVEDLSKRWDKQLVLHRRGLNNASSDNISSPWVKTYTHEIKYIVKYPFNEVLAWRGAISGRNDRITYLSSDAIALARPNVYNYWIGLKTDLTFDNSLSLGLNLPTGFKAKVFAEYYNQVNVRQNNTIVLGGDARYYKKIYREFIWANRVAASTSLGNKKLIYYMGGVDNWILPRFKQDVEIKNADQYVFQTLATNMRGFIQNARNGNSFAVVNSELRMPLFRYLSSRPLRSEFLNNFQIIGFGDLGTAWTGPNPFSEENSLFTTVIASPNSPIEITLKNQLNPLIGGYGWGIRSKVLGYFVRLDWAHGVQDGLILKRVFYISLNTDF